MCLVKVKWPLARECSPAAEPGWTGRRHPGPLISKTVATKHRLTVQLVVPVPLGRLGVDKSFQREIFPASVDSRSSLGSGEDVLLC